MTQSEEKWSCMGKGARDFLGIFFLKDEKASDGRMFFFIPGPTLL